MTLPSHASMLTGLYPPENGLHNNGDGALADVPTLAEILRDHGYQTAAIIGAVVLHANHGLDRGFDVYDDDMAGGERHGDETHLMRNGRMVVDAAIKWLTGRDVDAPFFCWVHLFDPHAPYDGHAEIFADRFAQQPYDGDIAFADIQIGRLIEHLHETNQYEDTLIVVAGDHGEGFGDHAELEHGFLLYNSTLRVPLIFSSPSLVAAGRRVPESVSLVDILPTVLDCLQIRTDAHTSGVTLQPALIGQPIATRTTYSETISAYAAFGWAPLKCVVADTWKYVDSARDELYNLELDPQELTNLAESDPQQCLAMQQIMADMQAEFEEVAASESALTDTERRQLEALGYVGGGSRHAEAPTEELPDVKDKIHIYNDEIAARKVLYAGQIDEAVAALRKVIDAAPEYTTARLTLGSAYQMQDRPDDAVAVYEDALRVDPHSHDAHFDFAKLLHSRGETTLAIEHYRAAIAARPSSAMAHINLATVLYANDDLQAARQSYEAGLEAFPDSTVGHFNYGVFLADQGEMDAAIEHVTRAAQLSPRNPQIQFQLASYLFQQQRFDEAAERFAETLNLVPRYPRAAEQLEEARRRAAASE
jgi:arylsulfatase A-like enzyme/Tfp pilus assembly protein PilF